MKFPREVYAPSSRVFDCSAVQLVYPAHYQVRRIRTTGTLSINDTCISVSQAIAGLEVGLEPIDETRYAVWFCRLPLSELRNLTISSFLDGVSLCVRHVKVFNLQWVQIPSGIWVAPAGSYRSDARRKRTRRSLRDKCVAFGDAASRQAVIASER